MICNLTPEYVSRQSESESHSVVSNSLWPHGLSSPWNSLGQNTGVGRLFLLQRIFPTQESNWGPLHCSWILYQLSYQGSYIIQKNTCTPMFIAALFTIAKTCGQLRHPTTGEWIEKRSSIYTMEFYSAIKKNETRDYHTKWSNSESERQIPYDITYMSNLKYDINGLIYRLVVAKGKGLGEGWSGSLGFVDTKQVPMGCINNHVLQYSTGSYIHYIVTF